MSLLERIYFFHAKIQSGRFPNTTCLIHEFEISSATAHRDVSYLRDRLLAPLAFNQKKNGYYYTNNDFQLPFEDSPAMTLILGLLGNLAEESGLSGLPEISAIRQRLQGVLFPGQRDVSELLHCEWSEKEIIKGSVFKTVLRALREQQQLKLHYRDGTGQMSKRIVEPMKLVNYQGRWYLLAWCRSRQGRRMFHLARMEETKQIDASTEHTIKKNDDWLTGTFGIFKGPISFQATIRFTGTAAEIVRHQYWHPNQKFQQKNDGLLLTLPVADDRELIMKVLQFGSQAEIIAPVELRKKLNDEIQGMTSLYST
jgi:predicted DNA-binding transcriptional regulator YafY